jgi:prevent-host-death family protein
MHSVNIYEAKTHLSELVQRASQGEEIIIARNGKPAARLVALAEVPERRRGGWEDKVWMSADYDAADEEVMQMMLGTEAQK